MTFNVRPDRFIWEDGDSDISLCVTCRHLTSGAKCAAYPGGIPLEIRTNERNHRVPQRGDHGIQYEALPNYEALPDAN